MLPERRAVKYNWLTMPLFDQVARADRRPRRQNESSFDYMNTSARPGIGAIRNLLEKMVRSTAKKPRKPIFGVGSAIAPCVAAVSTLRSIPQSPDVSANPDFLAGRNGVSQFYLEVTLAMPAGDPAAGRRLAELHDTLDRMNSP